MSEALDAAKNLDDGADGDMVRWVLADVVEELEQARAALTVTRDNIRSLGPAGALAQVYPAYTEWLRVVEKALDG